MWRRNTGEWLRCGRNDWATNGKAAVGRVSRVAGRLAAGAKHAVYRSTGTEAAAQCALAAPGQHLSHSKPRQPIAGDRICAQLVESPNTAHDQRLDASLSVNRTPRCRCPGRDSGSSNIACSALAAIGRACTPPPAGRSCLASRLLLPCQTSAPARTSRPPPPSARKATCCTTKSLPYRVAPPHPAVTATLPHTYTRTPPHPPRAQLPAHLVEPHSTSQQHGQRVSVASRYQT